MGTAKEEGSARVCRLRRFEGHSNTMSPIQFLMGHFSAGLASRVTLGVSELHLRSKLGPTVGPAEAVTVMDVVEPMGETHGGHQQGNA